MSALSTLAYRLNRPLYLPFGKPALLLLITWMLCMIMVPIARWTWGETAIYPLLNLSILLQAGAVFAILYEAWGLRHTLAVAITIVLFTLFAEMLGSRTGFPFGSYAYTDRLQPQIGHVPLLIPLAWFMMVPSAWAVAYRFRSKLGVYIIVSALALTAWDLLLDPQMVNWDLWQWETPGLYFGIPLSNYAGWLLVAALLTWLVRPSQLPLRPLLLVYTITWFLEWFGLAFFWGMPGPALVGGLVMGFFVLLGWHTIVKRSAETGEQKAW
jgi:putative membrane protein